MLKNFTLLFVLTFLSILNGFSQAPSRPTADDLYESQLKGLTISEFNKVPEILEKPGDDEIIPIPLESGKVMSCATMYNLATAYNTNNGQRGCMFNVSATNSVTIRCFDANLYPGTSNYYIYYRAGSHVGFENTAAAWTLIGGPASATSAGNNLPSAIPINISVVIPAGQTYSFYLTNDAGGGIKYTDGTAVGNFLAGDANITVYEGVGKSYPFGITFTVRKFNGHIYYDPVAILDGEILEIGGKLTEAGAVLNWVNNPKQIGSSFSLERSIDNRDFEVISDLKNDQSSYLDTELPASQLLYYRLRVNNVGGSATYSNSVELNQMITKEFELGDIFPNPTTGNLNAIFYHATEGQVDLQILDVAGRRVFTGEAKLNAGTTSIELNLSTLPVGVYTLKAISSNGTLETRKVVKQ